MATGTCSSIIKLWQNAWTLSLVGTQSGSGHIHPCVHVKVSQASLPLSLCQGTGAPIRKVRKANSLRLYPAGSVAGGLRPFSCPWGDLCYLSHSESVLISAASCFKWLVTGGLALPVISRNSAEEAALTIHTVWTGPASTQTPEIYSASFPALEEWCWTQSLLYEASYGIPLLDSTNHFAYIYCLPSP